MDADNEMPLPAGGRRNVEIKAKARNLERLRELAVAAGAEPYTIEQQTDTYFAVPHGRMKLRERQGQPAYLICYRRPDQQTSKASHYDMLDIADPELFCRMLRSVMNIRAVVVKHREVLLWKNVRVHLDRVEGLGDFLEFEAVLAPADSIETGQKLVWELIQRMEIDAADLIADSYVDMLERKLQRNDP